MSVYSRRPSGRKTVPPRRNESSGAFVRDLKARPAPEPKKKAVPKPKPAPEPETKAEVAPKPAPAPAPEPEPEPEASEEPSMEMTRAELNEAALAAGIEDPDKLPNKQAVLDAINAAALEG